MKEISVIVPVYNVEEYLRKCLDSLVNQTIKKEYEIIVVNDGSLDNCQLIIDEYVSKYPGVVFGYKKENGGLSSARNYGIEKSSGKYLAFVDSDDYVVEDFLEELYNKITEDDYDIVACDMEFIDDTHRIEKGIYDMTDDILSNFLLSPPCAPNKMYKRCLFKEDTMFPIGLYYEDLGTTPKLLKYAKKIAYINKPLYKYFIRSGSIMQQQKFNPKVIDIFQILDNIYNFFKENDLLDKYYSELEYLHINQLIHYFGLLFMEYEEGYPFVKRIKGEISKKFPKWKKNKYLKKEPFKKQVMCNLIYNNKIKLINFLRGR